MLLTTIEDIAKIVVRFTNTVEVDEFVEKHDFDPTLSAEHHVDNLYRDEYESDPDSFLDVLALDEDDEVIGRLTAHEFFAEKMGF